METVAYIRNNIDYKKTKLDDRKQVVESILNTAQNDLENYFDGNYKASLTSKDKLSHEDNVCRTLENLANYLLNSDEIKEEKANEEFQYMFHTDEQYFNMKVNRENSIEGMSTGSNEDTVIHFLIRSKKNYKKAKTQLVTKRDLNREGLVGEVLRAYNAELERITEKLKTGEIGGNRYLLTRASGQIKTDMVIVKDQLLGTFGYNANPSESTIYNLDQIDFTNELHIEALLRTFCDFQPDSDLAHIVVAYEELAKQSGLTPHERKIFKLFREGLKNNEIAEIMEFKNNGHVTKMAHTISRKIAKEAARIENMLKRVKQ
jgi:DNA-binding CsgD family transcriptional regulator